MLGGMEQQAQHRRGQPLPAHVPRVEQRLRRRRAKLIQCAIDLCVEGAQEFGNTPPGNRRRPLSCQRLALRIRQRLAARVGEKPIDDTCHVLKMETYRRHASGPSPQQFRGKPLKQCASFFASLNERVRNGLQRGGYFFDGSAKPCLWCCHRLKIARDAHYSGRSMFRVYIVVGGPL